MSDVVLFIVGLCLGSFSNVLIYRIPRGEGILGRSRCPSCGRTIPSYLNIPIVSYVILKGRCRFCGWRIPIRYPLVELLGGVIMVFSKEVAPGPLEFFRIALYLYLLLVLSFIDLEHFILPDVLTIPGALAGLILSPFSTFIDVREALVGALSGSLGFLIIREIYGKLRKREGLGLGDVKLMAMIGAFTGLQGVVGSVFLGSALGIVYSIYLMLKKREVSARTQIPFGPFLSLGSLLTLIALGF